MTPAPAPRWTRRQQIEAEYDHCIPKHLEAIMYGPWGDVEYKPGFAEPVPTQRAAE